jgi:hypothetical protein
MAWSLTARIATVEKAVTQVRGSLANAPASMTTGWSPPKEIPAPIEDDPNGPDDPNAPCLPRLQDYYGIHPGDFESPDTGLVDVDTGQAVKAT